MSNRSTDSDIHNIMQNLLNFAFITDVPFSQLDDEDDLDLEIFGNKKEKQDIMLSTYSFEVVDSLMNFSPITQMTVGESPFLSEEYKSGNHHDLEIVACSGYSFYLLSEIWNGGGRLGLRTFCTI